jgi:hypothetical protein
LGKQEDSAYSVLMHAQNELGDADKLLILLDTVSHLQKVIDGSLADIRHHVLET